jgi:Na+-translocating ferredoxin:NAD+ oxidoreductase RnfE subunit
MTPSAAIIAITASAATIANIILDLLTLELAQGLGEFLYLIVSRR